MNEIFYPLSKIQRFQYKQIDKVVYYCNIKYTEKEQGDTKKETILKWLRTLKREQIKQVFAFTSSFKVNYYLRMYKQSLYGKYEYIKLNYSPFEVDINQEIANYYYVRSLDRHPETQRLLQAYQYILDHVRVADYECLFDTIFLDGDLEDIIENLELITKGQLFNRVIKIDCDPDNEYYNVQWPQQSQSCNFVELLVEQFEQAVYLIFYSLDQKLQYLKQDELLDISKVKEKCKIHDSLKPFEILYDENSKFLSEVNILQNWKNHLENEQSDQNIQELLSQDIESVIYVPLKYIMNRQLLQLKAQVSEQLFKLFPLTKEKVDDGTEKRIKVIERGKGKMIQKISKLNEVERVFGPQTFESNILPKIVQKETTIPKLNSQDEGRLFSNREEELQGLVNQICKGIIQQVLMDYEQNKRYKREKQKKNKKQFQSESTSNCTDTQSQPVQQDQQESEQQKTKKQKKKQQGKIRKKEIQEKKKQKQKVQQVQEIQEVKEIVKQIEVVEEQVTPIIENATTTYDEGDFIEVRPKRKMRQDYSQKKKNTKSKKDFKDDSSLQDYKYVPQLTKQSSQSVQKTINPSFYLSDEQNSNNSNNNNNSANNNSNSTSSPMKKKAGLVKSTFTHQYENFDKHTLNQVCKKVLEAKLSLDILDIHKKEQEKYYKYRGAREIAIQRVKHVIRSYFRVDSQVFGSSATGLALEDSDVDLVVLGLLVFNKSQLYEPMRQLMEVLQKLKWVISCKHIFTASVPLLKVEVDPSIAYLQFNGPQLYYLMKMKNPDELNIRPQDPSKPIQIDITFELSIPSYMITDFYAYHVGLRSTEFTQQLCQNSYGFQEITILLKKVLKMKELNDSYTGGISSFCLTLMIAAMGEDTSLGSKLLNFLHKYGCNFDPDKWAICLEQGSQNNFLNIENTINNLPLTIYSPINCQIIQIYATQIQVILQTFRDLYLALMVNIDQIQSNIQKYIQPNKLMEFYNNNQYNKIIELIYQEQPKNLLDYYFK